MDDIQNMTPEEATKLKNKLLMKTVLYRIVLPVAATVLVHVAVHFVAKTFLETSD